ncbi:hypothetical protein PHYSODRAFT_318716 [Phytophthora sojae]|uniref:Uncharacterized protein n=1 Tax=Phytophthora sojae (strain P6497) TaxID=1094619 RepID=G5A644_PHYSP|nr:hypothetical protein PHYSODRAFT_318716 [Phytophthora sojae]EGZ08799.1 hypothetical protein PHYSODRAFT_318716 [Phytophthora sojae]|eukprot:XP_009535432.1 hypothetical protein PHYSODRAFT_318716 [Phytophthora sojae]
MQVTFISFLAAAESLAFIYAVCSATVFPLPFGVLCVAPPDLLVMTINQQIAVMNCQIALTVIHPVYIYGFVSLTGVSQVLFLLVLPIIKLIDKSGVNRALADYYDLKPQSVIFTVEVFNALYVSSALQSASSWALTVTIMVIDIVRFLFSMRDILAVRKEVKVLMAKIPQDHPLAKQNFLQTINRLFETRKIIPMETLDDVVPQLQTLAARSGPSEADNAVISSIFSKDERALFIKKSTQVLFITEYVILVEYVEVVLPVIYVAYRSVLFYMPNRAFHASMTELTIGQLLSSALNVLAYCSLEFCSLITSAIVLRRTLGISPWRQLGFELETHTGMIQSMLIEILIYTQISLAHLASNFPN